MPADWMAWLKRIRSCEADSIVVFLRGLSEVDDVR
jgi:hypothetical protein